MRLCGRRWQSLSKLSPKELVDQRYEKFRKMGNFFARGRMKIFLIVLGDRCFHRTC